MKPLIIECFFLNKLNRPSRLTLHPEQDCMGDESYIGANDDPARKAEKEGINGEIPRAKQGDFWDTYFHRTCDVPLKSISDIESSVPVNFIPRSNGCVGRLWIV